MKKDRIGIYLASPCGFCPKIYFPGLQQLVVPAIMKVDKRIYILDPWAGNYGPSFDRAHKIHSKEERVKELHTIDMRIGKSNKNMIDESKAVVAILNGTEPDSGVSAESAYACAKHKPVLGVRDDFRPSGENEGVTVNLQVQYFIEESGGEIVRNMDLLSSSLEHMLRQNKIL